MPALRCAACFFFLLILVYFGFSFVVSGVFHFILRIVSTFCNGLFWFSGSFSVCCLFVKSYLMFCCYCVWNNVCNAFCLAFCVLFFCFSFVVFRVFHLFLSVSGTLCNGLFWFSGSFSVCCLFVKSYRMFW